MDVLVAPEHGGDLARAIARYGIAASDWLDLSAAINPEPYAPPGLPAAVFQQLPAPDEALREAAASCYRGDHDAHLLAAAPGSQALIQWLPLLRETCRVAVPSVGYREHAFRWRWAGHQLFEYDARDPAAIERALRDGADVLVVINPNNPLTTRYAAADLLKWLHRLQQRRGWLVVDEAFMDAQPEHTLATAAGEPGLIVLRSLGKFFGLAGLRCGFALCEPTLAQALRVAIGPWPVSGPTAQVAEQALRDSPWQEHARLRLREHSRACAALLAEAFGAQWVMAADLFISVALPAERALAAQDRLARSGIWVRFIALDTQQALLRFGLVAHESQAWQRLRYALREISPC